MLPPTIISVPLLGANVRRAHRDAREQNDECNEFLGHVTLTYGHVSLWLRT